MAKNKNKVDPEVKDYLDCIATYEREFKAWETRVGKILKRYKDENRERKTDSSSRFNILWSNVQTLVPATFSRLPQPDVSRRFRDQDPVGRVAALILERSLDFEVQHYPDYRVSLRQTVYDRFLGGRGTAWARYEPHFKALEMPEGVQVTEDSEEAPVDEQLDYECAPIDYVHWKDFGHEVARTWEEVTKVWRFVYMDEQAVTERFGEETAKDIPYDAVPEDLKKQGKTDEVKKQACVIELWDKTTGEALWISKSMKEFVDRKTDPLKLQDFFPCPKPLYATLTNDSLVPIPDFTLYQDQARTLDILSDRIDGLSRMLQVKGVYDASNSALARLFTEGNNGTLLPIKDWAAFAEKNGLKGAVDVMDLQPIAAALETAYTAMAQEQSQVYQITGISDIIRGDTQAEETATAQQIKGQYASLRLRSMQDDVAQFATECLRLKAQIICGKFSPETIMAMAAVEQLQPADQEMIPQAMELLIGKDRVLDPSADAPNPLRSFRIDIAADTLVKIDEQQEKQDRLEMLSSFGDYLGKAAEVGAMSPEMIPLLIEVGKFGLTSFKIGKAIEGTFDQALEQLKQKAMNPQPPPPDPALEVAQVKADAEKQKVGAEMQMLPMKVQAEQTKAQAGIIKANVDLQKAKVQAMTPVQPAPMRKQ